MDKISVMLNTFNGGQKLANCLESAQWADEIVVIDSGSTDGSVELIKKHTDRYFHNDWPGYLAQREFGMQRCSGEWILILDQDEYVTDQLRDKLSDICRNPETYREYNAGWVRRVEHFWGRQIRYGNYNPSYQPRLARRGKCRWTGFAHTWMEVEGGEKKILRIKEPLWHDAYNTPFDYFNKINCYSELDVEERLPKGYNPSLARVIFSPLGMWWKCYIVHQGCRDGAHGYMNATAMMVYWFFRLSKAWHCRWLEKNRPDTWEDYQRKTGNDRGPRS